MPKFFILVGAFVLFLFNINIVSSAYAQTQELEIYNPEEEMVRKVQLKNNEVAELTIYLKSFGDPLDDFKVALFDDDGREVGGNVSDGSGIVKFLNIPPGRFRINVERKINPRGGDSTTSVGDFIIEVVKPIVEKNNLKKDDHESKNAPKSSSK